MLNFVLSETNGILIQKENREKYLTELIDNYNKFYRQKNCDMNIHVKTEEFMIDCFRIAAMQGFNQCKCYYSDVDFDYFKNKDNDIQQ